VSVTCCVKDCEEVASIKQPLKLGADLMIHVPLCDSHSAQWEGFASRQKKARERNARDQREADWMLDAALAIAMFPPGEPL
jgi:hypothetical protein